MLTQGPPWIPHGSPSGSPAKGHPTMGLVLDVAARKYLPVRLAVKVQRQAGRPQGQKLSATSGAE